MKVRGDEGRQRSAEVFLLSETRADERPPWLVVVVVGALEKKNREGGVPPSAAFRMRGSKEGDNARRRGQCRRW